METEALILQAQTQALAIKKDITQLAKEASELIITDMATLGKGGDLLKFLKAKLAYLDEDRKKITVHFDDAKKIVMAKYAPQVAECEAVKLGLEKKMYAYQVEERRRQEAAEAKRKEEELAQLEAQKKEVMEAAAESNNTDLLDAAVGIENEQEAIKATPEVKSVIKSSGEISTVRFQDNWKFEIINAALVPIDLKCPDEKKIKERVKGGAREIAGIRIYNEPYAVSR